MITPIENYPDLAKAIGVSKVFFKREDLHPYASHKGRSIPVMIKKYAEAGDTKFVVSSSGNAGLAAALFIHEWNANPKNSTKLSLDVLVGQNVAPLKLERLKGLADENIRVMIKERPLQALTVAIEEGSRSLRQSTDDTALLGYGELADELLEASQTGSIFIGSSSGTTAQALARSFLDAAAGSAKVNFQVHPVQTSSCHPFVDAFESYDGPDEASIADAIVDKVAHRKDALVPLVKETNGRGWTVTNEDIEAAQTLVYDHTSLEISTNSALSVAGLVKAVELGYELVGPAICMICGE